MKKYKTKIYDTPEEALEAVKKYGKGDYVFEHDSADEDEWFLFWLVISVIVIGFGMILIPGEWFAWLTL